MFRRVNQSWLRRVVVILLHELLWVGGVGIAFMLRFDGSVPVAHRHQIANALPVLLIARSFVFYWSGLFHGLWRYAGVPELKNVLRATTMSSIVWIGSGAMLHRIQVPRSIYLGEWLAAIFLVGGSRLLIRMVRERHQARHSPDAVQTLIIGAGDAGEQLLRDVLRIRESPWEVCAFLDDDPVKTGAIVHGVRVVGRADEATLRRVVGQREIKLVVLATPTAPGSRTREIAKICRQLGVQTKTIPSLADRVQGELSFSAIREVAIEDLLRRDPVQLDVAQVAGFLDQRTVLVTGAGGSIGSELARQVLRFRPRTLVLLDHDENALYHVERELCGKHPDVGIHIVVGDILDRERIDAVFRRHRPAVVLHAAAHKHVPLMEQNSVEAVKNNIFGTMNVADAAHVYSADAFVLISTDKAVNPTSVMGATKRVAEIAVQSRAGQSTTRFVAVRFGNVLGSSGSVVPLFREQIARGGPVTVTHPDMRRYFMTIQEATQLVLQAGALGSGGEIFLLDMGDPVKIVDLARDLIELSGLQPDVDIAIEFAGIRPGEKLFEELLAGGEAYDQTPHPKIVLGRIQPTPAEMVKRGLASLQKAVAADDEHAIRSVLSEWVPGATLSMRKSGEGPAMQIVALERSSQPA